MGKFGFVLAILSLGWSAQALGEDCPPLTILTSVDMKIGHSGRVFVPVQLNGMQKYLMIDTGGFFSEMGEDAVGPLQLTPHHTRLTVINVNGASTDKVVTTPFVLGNMHADAVDFMIAPPPFKFGGDLEDAVGILGANMLMGYDLDLDFAGRKVNLLSQKHCDGKVVYWPADVVSVVPIEMSKDFHINVPVQLDGHRYTAMLDTGAARTVLNLEVATRDFPIKPGDADTPERGKLTPSDKTAVYAHRFQSLSLEGVAISNPLLELLPDLVSSKLHHATDTVSNDTHIRDRSEDPGLSDMILGMDILHRFHLYVAYKEKKLYITPASGPAVAAAPSPPPAAAARAPVH
jgi:Aspartyl protease